MEIKVAYCSGNLSMVHHRMGTTTDQLHWPVPKFSRLFLTSRIDPERSRIESNAPRYAFLISQHATYRCIL